MTEVFGDQTVGFVAVTLGTPDANGVRSSSRTQVNVPGCRFRPVRAEELGGLFTVATKGWRCTAPPVAAVVAADEISELVYDGTNTPQRGTNDANVYTVIGGAMPFADMDGDLFKVTVLCERKKG